jgi:hypothetical protein
MNVRLAKTSTSATAGVVLLGSIGLGAVLLPDASAGMHSGGMGGHRHIMIGPTGNTVEIGDPANSMYIPKIRAASAKDVAKAQRISNGVNNFCRTHTAKGIKAKWRPGLGKATHQTHYFNPSSKSWGLNAHQPRAALIYKGKLGGVMFSGMPLPHLGSIPRAHSHMMMSHMEMLHVFCTPNLREAFTPNRVLGVKAATIALRLSIRPAVTDLGRHHLHAVRAKVRGYAGDRLQPVAPVGSPSDPGPDPVLRAMRTEIRHSLMMLHETQLRSVWRLIQSY